MDEFSILACMAYVELNPVRAKIAESLEDSLFTSAYDRTQARRERQTAEEGGGQGVVLVACDIGDQWRAAVPQERVRRVVPRCRPPA